VDGGGEGAASAAHGVRRGPVARSIALELGAAVTGSQRSAARAGSLSVLAGAQP
jgi:hypothetical protein